MTWLTRLALVLAAIAALGAQARAAGAPETVAQRVGETLPLDTRLVDENGQAVALGRYFGESPVVLVFGYYRCPTLCTTLMEAVLTSLSASRLETGAYRIVGIGIDPRESPADAKRKAVAYRQAFGPLRLDLLTGSERETRRLAAAAGVDYRYDARFDQYSHPLGFVVVTPEGRISRYFAGAAFDPRDVRLALVAASDSQIGPLTDRIFLRCAHYDDATGRYTLAVMGFVRTACVLLAAALGLWIWRRRRTR